MHEGYGPRVHYITFPWSNESPPQRTLSEHIYSPVRLPTAKIDVFSTLMAPIVKSAPSLVVHFKTMHAYTAPQSLRWSARLYRRLSYPRTAKVADAVIINSESLRGEVRHYLDVDPAKLHLIPEAVDHDSFARAIGTRPCNTSSKVRNRTGRSCFLSPRCGGTRTVQVCCVRSRWQSPTWVIGNSSWSGPGRDTGVRRRTACAGRPAGHRRRRGLGRRGTARGDGPLLSRADVFVYPSFNETFGLPILEAMACACPVVTSSISAMPETAGGAALLADPKDPESLADAIVEACGPERERLRAAGPMRAGEFTLGSHGRAHAGCVPRGPLATSGWEWPPMRILVTGGAGIHRLAHLRPSGRSMATTSWCSMRSPAPVHRDGKPSYLTPGVELYIGDVRNRELAGQPAAPRRRRLPLRGLPGLPDGLRPVHRRQRDVHGHDLRDHRQREAGPEPRRGCLVAGGHGRGTLPLRRARRADTRHAARVCTRTIAVGPHLPGVRRNAGDAAHSGADCQPAESVRDVEARRRDVWRSISGGGTGSRRSLSDTASCKGPDNRCTTPTPEPAESSTCTTCSVARPTLYEDGQAIRDYVNIHDVVDANVLVLTDDRAVGRVFNVGGGTGYTTEQFAEIVRRQYDSDLPGRISGEYRFGDTRHILSDIGALEAAGLGAEANTRGIGGRVCDVACGNAGARRDPRRGGRQDAGDGRGPKGPWMKAFLLAAGLGTRLRPITDSTPKCLLRVGGVPLLDIWLDALARSGVDEVLVNTHHLADLVRAHVADPHWPAARAPGGGARAARQRGNPEGQPGFHR